MSLEHYKVEVGSYGQMVSLGTTTIDGERFLLSIPSLDMVMNLEMFLKEDDSYIEKWRAHWRDFMFVCFHRGVNDVGYKVHVSVMSFIERLKSDDLLLDKIRVIPILIPLDRNGVFDENALSGLENGQPMYGGALYANGKLLRQRKAAPDKINQATEYLVPHGFESLTVGDSFEQMQLPWFKFGEILWGAFSVEIPHTLLRTLYTINDGPTVL